MIICRTPYRISFFGGGTDFPAWYNEHGGAVLATTIDKYCYLTCRYLPPFFEHRIRVVWSKIENCKSVDDVSHPSVREVVKALNIERCLEIHHVGDLPARSGMGSSSSFTVGLINALTALQGKMLSKKILAQMSIDIEQNALHESVGSQDQVCAAHGGFNHVVFHPSNNITVTPVTVTHDRLTELQSHLMLFYTGIERTSSEITKHFIDDIEQKRRQLRIMKDLVNESISILTSGKNILTFGALLAEAWQAKKSLSNAVTNEYVDSMFSTIYSAGAVGGKLTGAGAGGFLLVFAPPSAHMKIRERLSKLLYVPFSFETGGSQIIFADEGVDYTEADKLRDKISITPFQDIKELLADMRDPTRRAV